MLDSLSDFDLLPDWARQRGLTHIFIYSGPSMQPTFRPGHLLYVRPDAQSLQPGDVLVYQSEEAGHPIVHRAVALTPDGWIMRGDNNHLLDAAPVPTDKILGRVELVGDGEIFQVVRGGKSGLRLASLHWAMRSPVLTLRRILGWPYRALRRYPPLRSFLARRFASELQTIHLETPTGPLVKTLYRGQVVARWQAQPRRFEVRKPFDLFIDPPH
jgi:hypothetical protein